MNIVIVDDSTIVLARLEAMLSGIAGVRCVGRASNAGEAIRTVAELQPDVVVLDIRLAGGRNGMDVLEQIKKSKPSPVVMMLTNYPYPQYRERCLALGADYFFDKVTEIEMVCQVFARLLEDKQ